MTHKPAIRGSAAYFGKLAGAFALTMALSFGLVILLLSIGKSKPATPQAIARAEQLRTFSNELLQATNEYLEKIERDESQTDWERWLQRQYRPNTNDLRQRIVAANLTGDTYLGILQASDKVVAMGLEPKRLDLQSTTKNAVIEASNNVEAEIAVFELGPYLTVKPITPKFRRDK